MDGGAWWATVHGVTKSGTQLSDTQTHTHTHTHTQNIPPYHHLPKSHVQEAEETWRRRRDGPDRYRGSEKAEEGEKEDRQGETHFGKTASVKYEQGSADDRRDEKSWEQGTREGMWRIKTCHANLEGTRGRSSHTTESMTTDPG